MRRTLGLALFAVLSLSAWGCGGDDGGGDNADADINQPDADPNQPDAADTCPAAGTVCPPVNDPIDDGTGQPAGGIPDVIITEINPGCYVTVYNTTDAEIDLNTPPQSSYLWCQRPLYPGLQPKVAIPAKSYAVLEYNGLNDGADGGELVLYSNGAFSNPNSVLDYVCWGTGRSSNRQTEATTAGKWSGGCAPAIPEGGSLHRKVGVAGTTAADYEANSTPNNITCTP